MDWFQAAVLAIIQGLTEFLPISSSAHLILPKEVLGWPDQGLAFDVAVHVGSLIAIVFYFRQQVFDLAGGCWLTVQNKSLNPQSRLFLYLVVATIPAGLTGLAFGGYIEAHLRTAEVIAFTTLIFGLLLWWSDVKGAKQIELIDMSVKLALFIGLAQVLALIPGTSRSGITMTAALLFGMQRNSAARFSFLMAIPIITLSGAYEAVELLRQNHPQWDLIGLGVGLSALSAYLCIYWFMALIERIGMLPFVIYRIFLSLLLFVLIL